VIDLIRVFFQRRAASRLTKRLRSVSFLVQFNEFTQRGQFPFPGQHTRLGLLLEGDPIGHVDYLINALGDRVYINKIEVDATHQRQGMGLALLWHLWQVHQVPIVPLFEYELSYGFWDKARQRFRAAGAELHEQICSAFEMDEEKQRWQHLVPESEVEKSIREYWEWVASEHAAGRPAGPGIP